MAVFVDFEEEEDESWAPHLQPPQHQPIAHTERGPATAVGNRVPLESLISLGKEVNGIERGFQYALGCYPVALSLASHLDLNDLASLSSTCWAIHESLKQFSHQLVVHSLRCIHDEEPLLVDVLVDLYQSLNLNDESPVARGGAQTAVSIQHAAMAAAVHQLPRTTQNLSSSASYKSKLHPCARDLVAACRKCGTVVCRNCTAKPPSLSGDRHRRLCRACLDAPLTAHLMPLQGSAEVHDCPPLSSASSTRSTRSTSSSSGSSSSPAFDDADHGRDEALVSDAFQRDPCTCTTRGVFLCAPCGNNLRSADTTYKRVWTWRSRYSTHIGGGLGTGLGVGNQGQKCGRGESCLENSGSAVCWVEIDCSEGHGQDVGRESHDASSSSRTSTPSAERTGSLDLSNKPGYLSQEIEGIGGVVKKKVKKRVKVGATVWEYDEERATGKYLEREASEKERSWCGWCNRVCPGEQDRRLLDHHGQSR